MKIWSWTLLILFLILAIPYTFRILELKTLTGSDIPEVGGWAPLSLGNIYYQSHSPYVDSNGQIVAPSSNNNLVSKTYASKFC